MSSPTHQPLPSRKSQCIGWLVSFFLWPSIPGVRSFGKLAWPANPVRDGMTGPVAVGSGQCWLKAFALVRPRPGARRRLSCQIEERGRNDARKIGNAIGMEWAPWKERHRTGLR